MPYKPKFCCQCGEKVERTGWTILTSRRFCELCETDYKLDDWILKIVFALGIVFGIYGFGISLQKAEKPLNIAPNYLTNNLLNDNKIQVNSQIAANTDLQPVNQSRETNSVSQTNVKPNPIAPKQNLSVKLPEKPSENPQNASVEKVYFCGAQTKKGTPCSRRMKGGGRCWQHTGQPAMLPQDKLIASQ